MSVYAAAAAATVLSCGLNATPDGEMAPGGSVAMMEAPITDDLAASLAKNAPPPARTRFSDSRDTLPEWIIGVRTDPQRGTLVARLSSDIFGYKVRFGWAGITPGADGASSFQETAAGTCRIKSAAPVAQKAQQ